jgi:hypothetical protein
MNNLSSKTSSSCVYLIAPRLFDTDLVCITEQSPGFLQPYRKTTTIGAEITEV